MGLLSALRNLLDPSSNPGELPGDVDPVQLATAALFVEVMRSDFDEAPAERQVVESALARLLALDAAGVSELLAVAEDAARESVSLFEFTHPIHQNLSPEQKVEIIEGLWRVVFADGRMDAHEDHMMSKIRGLLHIPQEDYVAAKQRARDGST
ncbi:MAG: TerB family tellurite resistance protein [Acidobacteria bacterium]|nr:TerB family tellurite resistance protein [Acidobacteriota bacterium]